MKSILPLNISIFLLLSFSINSPLYPKEQKAHQIYFDKHTFQLYPKVYAVFPEIPSPFTAKDGTEVLLALTKDNQYAIMPVSVENGSPLHYSRRVKSVFGKDQQLLIDAADFPTLANTGLHSDEELKGKEMITGFPVSLITYIGLPGRFSGAGFMAEDEDIISVLRTDNQIVKKLGLTHPQMAKPLYHVWNIILKEIELGNWGRYWDNIHYLFYNERKILFKAQGTKGWQISIFQDEIQGSFDIEVKSVLTTVEKAFLKENYSQLPVDQINKLEEKLTTIHFSEMAPYYIMRYGFYEGHTDYRSDPIAIAFVFGLNSLQEIENAFQGNLHNVLTNHFTSNTVKE